MVRPSTVTEASVASCESAPNVMPGPPVRLFVTVKAPPHAV